MGSNFKPKTLMFNGVYLSGMPKISMAFHFVENSCKFCPLLGRWSLLSFTKSWGHLSTSFQTLCILLQGTLAVFMIFHLGNCYSESNYYNYEDEYDDYLNDGNFSYMENQQNVKKKVMV